MHHVHARMQRSMQYTLRNIPKPLDQALRRRARDQGKTLTAAAVDAMARGLGLSEAPVRHRSVRDVVGALQKDHELRAALSDQRRIDPELWK
jgi:hypothetical protein